MNDVSLEKQSDVFSRQSHIHFAASGFTMQARCLDAAFFPTNLVKHKMVFCLGVSGGMSGGSLSSEGGRA